MARRRVQARYQPKPVFFRPQPLRQLHWVSTATLQWPADNGTVLRERGGCKRDTLASTRVLPAVLCNRETVLSMVKVMTIWPQVRLTASGRKILQHAKSTFWLSLYLSNLSILAERCLTFHKSPATWNDEDAPSCWVKTHPMRATFGDSCHSCCAKTP